MRIAPCPRRALEYRAGNTPRAASCRVPTFQRGDGTRDASEWEMLQRWGEEAARSAVADEGLHREGVEGRGEVGVGVVEADVGVERAGDRSGSTKRESWDREQQDRDCRGDSRAAPAAGAAAAAAAAGRWVARHTLGGVECAVVHKQEQHSASYPEEDVEVRCGATFDGLRPWTLAWVYVRSRCWLPDNGEVGRVFQRAAAAVVQEVAVAAGPVNRSEDRPWTPGEPGACFGSVSARDCVPNNPRKRTRRVNSCYLKKVVSSARLYALP